MNNNTIKFLLKLKNASLAKNKSIFFTVDKLCFLILKSLYKDGYIQGYLFVSEKKVKIFLRYMYNKSLLDSILILSTSSRKIYIKYQSILKLKIQNKKMFILTKGGIFTLLQCKQNFLGGLVLFLC